MTGLSSGWTCMVQEPKFKKMLPTSCVPRTYQVSSTSAQQSQSRLGAVSEPSRSSLWGFENVDITQMEDGCSDSVTRRRTFDRYYQSSQKRWLKWLRECWWISGLYVAGNTCLFGAGLLRLQPSPLLVSVTDASVSVRWNIKSCHSAGSLPGAAHTWTVSLR